VEEIRWNRWQIYSAMNGRNPLEPMEDLRRNEWKESPEYPGCRFIGWKGISSW
jgi:hypothetical protein